LWISYNQLAWLVANTEGDFDEAVKMSLKSVELIRARLAEELSTHHREVAINILSEALGGHLDTLAHCYAAKKDFDNAVKTQTEAARLIPHQQQIARKLELFRKLQSEQQGQPKADENDKPKADQKDQPPGDQQGNPS
jgi:cytochrome c-type biogenesis protein CcmH/NrfG